MHGRDAPGRQRLEAGQTAHKIRLSLAVEADHTDHFAGMKGKVYRRRVWPDFGIYDTQQSLLIEPSGKAVRCDGLGAVGAGDQFQDARLGDLVLFQATDVLAVAQHRRPVGNAHQFGDAVRDDEHAFSLGLQLPHLAEQAFSGFEVERGRGFIQNQDLRIGQQGASNGDPLFETERQVADGIAEVQLKAQQLVHQRCGFGDLLVAMHRAAEQPVGAEVQIVQHRAGVGNQHFLENIGDAHAAGFDRRGCRLAKNGDLSAVWQQDSRNNLGKRALA